jgi:hypothetical protein
MRVLYLHANTPDYLAESLLHGLRSLLGGDCVDVPRYDSLYAPLSDGLRAKLRGQGFSLYGLLPDLPELAAARFNWASDISRYDLVVIADVWRSWDLLWHPAVRAAWRKLVLLDGSDGPAFFPCTVHLWRRPWAYVTGATRRPCFKREFFGGGNDYGFLTRWLPAGLRRRLPDVKRGRPIAFSIPAEKVCDFGRLEKVKEFPRHVVDDGLAARLPGAFHSAVGSDQHAFTREQDYYGDLRQSRFGVTAKRAGWDCLRHYELAANGCVLCFKDFDRKPVRCAPHGLTASNCLAYHDPDDLLARVRSLSRQHYEDLLGGTEGWIRANTTTARAKAFLADCVA